MVVRPAEIRSSVPGSAPFIEVELTEYEMSDLTLEYRIDRTTLISVITSKPYMEKISSFGPKRSRADQYFYNWLAVTSPVSHQQARPLAAAAAQLVCGLLRTIHVTNEGKEGAINLTEDIDSTHGVETSSAGKQLVNVLRLPAAFSDVRRVEDFFALGFEPLKIERPTSQMQLILTERSAEADLEHRAGGSTTALAFLASVPSLREVYGRMVREMLKIGIRGQNECSCILDGSASESLLPSAHEEYCGIFQAASLGVEMVAACICSLFIEGPTAPRLSMFNPSPLRWAISKAIEQSVLTGSALISGADLIKSVLVVAGYRGNYGYGPLIVCTGGQALVLAALNDMSLNSDTIGKIIAVPGAILHRGQYYQRLVAAPRRRLGGRVLKQMTGIPGEARSSDEVPRSLVASSEGVAVSIDTLLTETETDLQLIVRSRQENSDVKEHDLWHCITAALTANMLGRCGHKGGLGYVPRAGESINIVGTGTDMATAGVGSVMVISMVHGSGLDRLLACGVNVNIVVQISRCLKCAVSACKQVGYSYLVI